MAPLLLYESRIAKDAEKSNLFFVPFSYFYDFYKIQDKKRPILFYLSQIAQAHFPRFTSE